MRKQFKSLFLWGTLFVGAYSCMSAVTLADIDGFTGRWGYISQDDPDGGPKIHIMKDGTVEVPLYLDGTVVSYGNGQAFVQPSTDMANECNNVFSGLANTTKINISVSNRDAVNYGGIDHMNSVFFDVNEAFIDPSDKKTLAMCRTTSRYKTKPNICGGNAYELAESDIIFHKYESGRYHWKVLDNNSAPSSTKVYGANTDYDYPSVLLHELGHFLGLGHITKNASHFAVMWEVYGYGRILTADDKYFITKLYDRGSSGIGVIADCNLWNGKTQIRCRTYIGTVTETTSGKCDCTPKACVKTENGQEGGFTCKRNTENKGTMANNWGLSPIAVQNWYTYIESVKPFNGDRAERGLFIVLENEAFFKSFLSKYDIYSENGRIMTVEYSEFSEAFIALDSLMDMLMPLADATLRCETNVNKPELNLTASQVVLINNFIDKILVLNISDRLKGELNFIKGRTPYLVGKNLKQAYEHLILAPDPNL